MLKYFIIFGLAGFGVGKIITNLVLSLIAVLSIAIFWGIGHPHYAFITLAELMIGYGISRVSK